MVFVQVFDGQDSTQILMSRMFFDTRSLNKAMDRMEYYIEAEGLNEEMELKIRAAFAGDIKSK